MYSTSHDAHGIHSSSRAHRSRAAAAAAVSPSLCIRVSSPSRCAAMSTDSFVARSKLLPWRGVLDCRIPSYLPLTRWCRPMVPAPPNICLSGVPANPPVPCVSCSRYERYSEGPPRLGWIFNMLPTSIPDDSGNEKSGLDIYFLEQDGGTFKATVGCCMLCLLRSKLKTAEGTGGASLVVVQSIA